MIELATTITTRDLAERAKAAAEVKESLDYTKKQKQIDAAALDAISRDQYLTPEEKIEKIKEYLGQGGQAQGGQPTEGTQIRDQATGKVLTFRGGAWLDEQGKPVNVPAM